MKSLSKGKNNFKLETFGVFFQFCSCINSLKSTFKYSQSKKKFTIIHFNHLILFNMVPALKWGNNLISILFQSTQKK